MAIAQCFCLMGRNVDTSQDHGMRISRPTLDFRIRTGSSEVLAEEASIHETPSGQSRQTLETILVDRRSAKR